MIEKKFLQLQSKLSLVVFTLQSSPIADDDSGRKPAKKARELEKKKNGTIQGVLINKTTKRENTEESAEKKMGFTRN